jgi:phospholipid/cholesterol/gamma-HCH transport system substrate-binding protein
MGGKFISIYPGKDNDKFILEGETIAGKNGEVVSITKDVGDLAKRLSETFGVQQREQIKNTLTNIESTASQLQEFMNANKNLISENDKDNLHQLLSNINTITFNLNNLINDESSNIKNSIQSFNNFMKTVPGISNSIDAMLIDVGAVVKNINSGDGSLAKIINQNELYDNVNGLVLDARSLLDDVKNNPAKYLRAWFEAKKK